MRKEKIIKKEEIKPEKKQPYVEPKVIATYEKEELEETTMTHGKLDFLSVWQPGVSSGGGG